MGECIECKKRWVAPNYKLCLNCCNRLRKCAICATKEHYTEVNPFCKQCLYDINGTCEKCNSPLDSDKKCINNGCN